ncbi:cell surface protein SprA [Terrimonas sp. NA20]|uniref:Cell surface protein SprA n=1 Tax=Terrimonas ginsenosidimutans TaxID=2908004 RepID=A0ABS9KPD9_9BACT|nr:cell surface protein SprA [Terrimonas ginsenosidimutans]MCG2614169.1 cell surface protein SprA [Terrimonas ginsenosidimutans]
MKFWTAHIFRTLVCVTILLALRGQANARFLPAGFQDTTARRDTSPLRYPIQDRYGDPYSSPNKNPFDLKDSAFLKRDVQYDPLTGEYYIIETVGGKNYRTPVSFKRDEFLKLQGRKDEAEYFRKRADMMSELNRRLFQPKFQSSPNWFNRIVGFGKVDIKPSGYVGLLMGYQGQNIKNPTLPERARRNGGLDFNMNAQLQVDAQIGDKLRLPINYNTLANFDFENQLNLNYQGKDDEIIKQFQLGNVNFTSKGTLIPGAQSLFGVKTQAQFGKLFVTGVLANQRAQRQSINSQGGSSAQTFAIKADEYEENRHFLLAQYFRRNFNNAMRELPIVNSNVQIQRMEVWVTNRTGATTDTRDIVALMDLGEGNPFTGPPGNPDALPYNTVNGLYQTLASNPNSRNSSLVQSTLTSIGLTAVQDFEKTFARKLQPNDYYFNPQIGFLSLNQPLQPDEVLGVAYQYTYNGVTYQVGEFSQDVPPDTTGATQKVLFLKLLKATSQRTNLPIWDLMMKNVYSVGYGQLERADFKLDLLYEEPSLGEKRYLPPADVLPAYEGQPLISLLNLDRLNNQNDPQPDGVFDFIEGFTVLSSMSRVIFPVLEPFGHDLDYVYPSAVERQKYLYYPLYDTIKAIAQTYANLNRFRLSGRSKTTTQSAGEYQLGFNIPRNSVTVTAGGQTLQEGVDYDINYDLGTLRVINQAILNSGVPVNIQYENQAAFGIQQRSFLGLRLDYLVNKKLSVGGTLVRLSERPFFVKQSYGEDPIRNTMYGLDADYRSDWPRLTKFLNKLPFYKSDAMSSITAYAEAAVLQPGHAPQIGKGGEGLSYVDDFEGTRSAIDLRFPLINWQLSSVPQQFPESQLNNDLASGYNRAKLAWYNIEPVLQERNNNNNPLAGNRDELSKPETRQVFQTEIFPQRTNDFGQGLLTTFDLAFYPKERGPYNFENRAGRINPDGLLTNPGQAWGGIQRNIDQTDFETGNIEYIEFWLQDPYVLNTTRTGGKLFFNLGNISEDVLKDGKRQYENGLPTPTNNAQVDNTTVWGKVPSNPLQVTNAFSNDPADRQYQDVGLDGLTDDEERTKFQSYLTGLQAISPSAYAQAVNDPSADNFRPYRDASYDAINAGILRRYKDINNPHGNSPIATASTQFVNAFTQYPDAEEMNRDNTLNEVEEYFQYEIDITPNMQVGSNFITDIRRAENIRLPNDQTRSENWYLFRIPVSEFTSKVGNIPDFKSIRFIRMFVSGFEDSVVMRFGKLELIRNQWRKFQYQIDTTGNYVTLPANNPAIFNTLAVNVEENDQRSPIRYRIPPGIERQQQLSNNNVQLYLNEQALSVQVDNLPAAETRGVFKNMNLDMRQYGKLRMFIHAEARQFDNMITDGSLTAVVRFGSDLQGNYYEVRVPLKKTPWFTNDSLSVWPEENNLDFDLQELTRMKLRRNQSGAAPSAYYSERLANGRVYAMIGNPNLGEVRSMLLSVENSTKNPISAEVWFNELRFSNLDEKGGWAATGRVDLKLADLGSITLAGTARSRGFGTLEQRVNERSREDMYTFDVSANIDAGKLLPRKLGIQIPVYAGISRIAMTPEYDPYDLDIKLRDKLDAAPSKEFRDSIKNDAQDITTIKTLNFTNVKKLKVDGKRPKIWSLTNLDFSYSYIHTQQHNPLIENYEMKRERGVIGYNYAPQAKYVEPFKFIKSKSKWLALVRDFNFNYVPTQLSFRADIFRQFGATRPRNVGGGPYKIPETYDKYFTFDRYYIMQWNLTRSLSIDFTATNNARVDEPFGRLDTGPKKDSVRDNFLKGGRNTQYQQQLIATYNVPMQKIPFLDWTNLRATYTTQYNWLASSLLARSLGNTLSNTQTRAITGELNFEQLYSKSKFLRAAMAPPSNSPKPATPAAPTTAAPQIPMPQPIADSVLAKMTRKERRKAKKEYRRQVREYKRALKAANRPGTPEVGGAVRTLTGVVTAVKRVVIQYTKDFGTTLPGYMDSTRILGYNPRSHEPGFGFIFGYQPDTNWINRMGAKGLLSTDPRVTAMIQQRYNERLNLTAQVSPFRDFNIDLNLDKTFSKQYSELHKDITGTSGLARLSPYAAGSFSISYISYQTLFDKFDPNIVSETFKTFEANRVALSQKLGLENPYANPTPGADGYVEGYGRYAQDVVIPSFLAAYTKKNVTDVKGVKNNNPNISANPFSGFIPKPNWVVTYSGLSNVGDLQRIFTNVTIRHGYHSTLSMNSFNTALLFQDPFRLSYPSFRDSLTGNFIPYFLVPNISIQEQFDPLVGVEMTFTNQLSTRFEYRKSRTLSLSLIDYQLADTRSYEFSFGFDWRKKGVPFIKKLGKMKLDNDITFKFDFSIRDDATANSKLDQGTAFGTSGQKVIRIAPSIDYILNNRVSLKFYFEQNRNIPKISNAFPITNTRAGLQVNISLAQ